MPKPPQGVSTLSLIFILDRKQTRVVGLNYRRNVLEATLSLGARREAIKTSFALLGFLRVVAEPNVLRFGLY